MDMDVFMADDTTMMQTATATVPAQSDIKIGDSVSAIAMTSVSQSNKDETTLVEALKKIQASTNAKDINGSILDVCDLFTKDFAAVCITKHKCNALTNGLIYALNLIGTLPIDNATGLIVASFVLGQSCWVSCVNELSIISANHKDQVIDKFSVYLHL